MSKSDNLGNHKKLNRKDKSTNSSFSRIMKKIGSTAALMALLNFASPADIKAQSGTDISKEKTEVVVGLDMLNSIQQKTGVNLPNEYKQKAKDFLDYSKIFKDKDAREFTENFITKQMKEDRGISKENQQLFVLYSIFEYTVNEDIYDGEDGDETRLQEFETAVELIDDCGKLYVEELTQYMKKLSAEARQQSAEARQQSAEARQNTIEYINKSLDAMIDFYNLYKISPDSKRLESFKSDVNKFTFRCNQDGFDYKDMLLKKLGDKKFVEDLLKFYEVES